MKWSDDMKYIETDDITIYHVNLEKVKKMYENNEPLSKFEKYLEAVKNKLIELTKDEEFMDLYNSVKEDTK